MCLHLTRERGDISRCLTLAEAVSLFELLIQLAPRRIFQNEIDAACVVEIAIQTQDVLVPGQTSEASC